MQALLCIKSVVSITTTSLYNAGRIRLPKYTGHDGLETGRKKVSPTSLPFPQQKPWKAGFKNFLGPLGGMGAGLRSVKGEQE